jgi:hypothetical protein
MTEIDRNREKRGKKWIEAKKELRQNLKGQWVSELLSQVSYGGYSVVGGRG